MMAWWGLGVNAGPQHPAGVNCRMLPEKELVGIEVMVSKGPI